MDWKRTLGTIRFSGKGSLDVGAFSSTTIGYGLGLSSSRTCLQNIYADDGGSALTVGSAYRAGRRRTLLGAVNTGDVSIFGGQDHLKVASDNSGVTGHLAGHWGYMECSAAGKVNIAAGVKGMADLPSGAVITSGGVLSAFMAVSNDLGGTHTGKAVPIHVPNPVAGSWDAFAEVAASTGCIDAATTKSTPSGVDNWLLVNVGGTAHYIPMYHSKTA
jgi:hypothetical protein